MKVRKRLVIVADIICDEGFDTTDLLLCEDLNFNSTAMDTPPIFVDEGIAETGNQWQIESYAFCEETVTDNEVE